MQINRRKQISYLSFAGVFCFTLLLSITSFAAEPATNPADTFFRYRSDIGFDLRKTIVPITSRAETGWPNISGGNFNFFTASLLGDKSTATVMVDCSKGDSINQALTKHSAARNLTIEIRGLCHENVVVTRDYVTLHGLDPANDGIQALINTEISDVSVWVRQAQLVTLENLKLTGGFSGLLATNVTLTNLRIVNCRLEGNSGYGAQLQNSLIQAANSTFSTNGNINAGVFGGSRLECAECTFADPQGVGPLGTNRANIVALTANRVILSECTLTNGGVTFDDSFFLVFDSTISAFVPGGNSILALGSSAIVLTRVQVTGNMIFNQGSNAQLLGVTQPGPGLNQVDDSAYVRIGDASPATGGPPSIASVIRGFNLRNFSKATLLQTSEISGSLNCSQGADAFCTTPGKVSGTSNCGLCPKP